MGFPTNLGKSLGKSLGFPLDLTDIIWHPSAGIWTDLGGLLSIVPISWSLYYLEETNDNETIWNPHLLVKPSFAETARWLVYWNMCETWHETTCWVGSTTGFQWVFPSISHESSNSAGRTAVLESGNFTLNVLGCGIFAHLSVKRGILAHLTATVKCWETTSSSQGPMSHTPFSSRAFLWPAIVPFCRGLGHGMDPWKQVGTQTRWFQLKVSVRFRYVSGDLMQTGLGFYLWEAKDRSYRNIWWFFLVMVRTLASRWKGNSDVVPSSWLLAGATSWDASDKPEIECAFNPRKHFLY